MRNGIIINGVKYRAFRFLGSFYAIDPCEKCDLRRICKKRNVQYPCELFITKDHLVYFKKI